MRHRTDRPATALDDLIAEQTMAPRRDPRQYQRDDVAFARPKRRCPECRCFGFHVLGCPEDDR